MITDEHLKITLVNAAFQAVTGYSLEEVRDKTPSILKSGKQDKSFYDSMWKELDKKEFGKVKFGTEGRIVKYTLST